ncbi:MAG: RNA methyltransferase [Anaerolineaceae bacterium]|nr:RNA methyltransferase [Anaerolineaceae bacterium]
MQNPKIQQVRALISRRKIREDTKSFVVEGVRIMEDALGSGQIPELVLFSNQISERGRRLLSEFERKRIPVDEINQDLMNAVSDTRNSQGLLAIYKMTALPAPQQADFVLILDNIRDPGNLGTILRTAISADVKMVLLTPGTTDLYSPKVLRAGMGAHFSIPVFYRNWEQITELCKKDIQPPIKMFLAEAGKGTSCWETDLKQPTGLIIGSEAAGPGTEALNAADELISIPMPGKSESLNAAIAASILIFEVIRQRKT